MLILIRKQKELQRGAWDTPSQDLTWAHLPLKDQFLMRECDLVAVETPLGFKILHSRNSQVPAFVFLHNWGEFLWGLTMNQNTEK